VGKKGHVERLPKWMKTCIEYDCRPEELGITDQRKIDLFNKKIAELRDTNVIAKQVGYRSASVDTIKDRTGGRNRKERRGS